MKYAVDMSIKFDGKNYHCMTDDEVSMFTKDSFDEMKANNPGLKLFEEEDFFTTIRGPYVDEFRTEWKEVTKEEWWNLYECLPPFKTGTYSGVFLFCCPEATIDYMHTWGAEVSGKYYFATRSKYDNPYKLIKDLPCT